jgi:hypothetical protein
MKITRTRKKNNPVVRKVGKIPVTTIAANPALIELAVLSGDWNMELANAAFLPRSSDTVNAKVSFVWSENGAFLVLRMGDKPPRPPEAIWLIGRDESTPEYKVLYFDSRKVSRVYEMSFSGLENVEERAGFLTALRGYSQPRQ